MSIFQHLPGPDVTASGEQARRHDFTQYVLFQSMDKLLSIDLKPSSLVVHPIRKVVSCLVSCTVRPAGSPPAERFSSFLVPRFMRV